MRVSATYEDDLAVIAVAGELDAKTTPVLREAVDAALGRGARWLLVDLHELDFIGSVGVGELIRAVKLLGERGGDLAVACARPNLTRVFDISGTSEMLHLSATEEEARASLSASRLQLRAACPEAEAEEDTHGQAE